MAMHCSHIAVLAKVQCVTLVDRRTDFQGDSALEVALQQSVRSL